jgi:hypothetical protein
MNLGAVFFIHSRRPRLELLNECREVAEQVDPVHVVNARDRAAAVHSLLVADKLEREA